MRLIDADALIERIEALKAQATSLRDLLYMDGIIVVINAEPTVEKQGLT